jgi:hypothetical protein
MKFTALPVLNRFFNVLCYSAIIFFDVYFGFQDVFVPFIEQGFVQVSNKGICTVVRLMACRS